jgi:hypothetical protein
MSIDDLVVNYETSSFTITGRPNFSFFSAFIDYIKNTSTEVQTLVMLGQETNCPFSFKLFNLEIDPYW